MGSCTVIRIGFGKTADEAFKAVQAEAEVINGHQDGYSGDINSVHGFDMKPLGQKSFTKLAINKWIDRYFEGDDYVTKRECVCLELPRSHAKGCSRGFRKFIFVACCPEQEKIT